MFNTNFSEHNKIWRGIKKTWGPLPLNASVATGLRRSTGVREFLSKNQRFLEILKSAAQFRLIDLILEVTIFLPIWHPAQYPGSLLWCHPMISLQFTHIRVCSAKQRGVETPFPHEIKRKTVPNSSNKVSIRLQEFPHWIFLFHCRLLTSIANLRVAGTSVKLQPCFNVIVSIPHPQVTLLVQKGVGTPFPRVPTPLHPCSYPLTCLQRQFAKRPNGLL